jgi:hypothetical protein
LVSHPGRGQCLDWGGGFGAGTIFSKSNQVIYMMLYIKFLNKMYFHLRKIIGFLF